MTKRPEMPCDSRPGVMSNQTHNAISQAIHSDAPSHRSARVSGGGPKARGKRARRWAMSATDVTARLRRHARESGHPVPSAFAGMTNAAALFHASDRQGAQLLRRQVDQTDRKYDQHDDSADLLVVVEADH